VIRVRNHSAPADLLSFPELRFRQLVIAFAALPGWTRPLEVAAFYAGLELFTNMVLETVLYAGAMGVSQVSLMVSVAFWTWLWGPLGLLMATPLTVCLVVLGKHVPGLKFLGTLLSDAPALTPESNYYQRLLARDHAEAADIVERFVKNDAGNSVFDTLLIPALNFAERDRLEGLLSAQEEAAVIDTTREVLDVLSPDSAAPVPAAPVTPPAPALPRLVAIAATNSDAGVTRSAVLTVGDDVQILKVGDMVLKLVIKSIGTDVVELTEPATGRTFRLSLQ